MKYLKNPGYAKVSVEILDEDKKSTGKSIATLVPLHQNNIAGRSEPSRLGALPINFKKAFNTLLVHLVGDEVYMKSTLSEETYRSWWASARKRGQKFKESILETTDKPW